LDEYDRPVAWRHVVRLALGPTLGQLRDAETSIARLEHVSQPPADDVPAQPAAPTTPPPGAGRRDGAA